MFRRFGGCPPAAAVTAFFILLTAIMTWPQVRVLGTHAMEHQDVYFNMWRLRWIAHALWTSPGSLFDGNVFHPERGVLAYSDAMLVEGLVAAPLLWAGVPPVLVHNLLLLGAIVASSVGMFVLARHLTGSTPGALLAGVVFGFAPYRFDHYFHLELQWTIWSPWAFWALQRTLETGSIRFGLLTGLFVAVQVASSVYYGMFLSVLIAVVAIVQLIGSPGRRPVRTFGCLALGGTLAAGTAAIYFLPYSFASERVGLRSEHEVRMFSARPRDYRVATPSNLLYSPHTGGAPERRLFPGVLPVLLALTGLLLVPPGVTLAAYLIGLVLAFELSLGQFGLLYPWLYDHVTVFKALRAPARAGVFVLLFLGVLAAYGMSVLTASLAARRQQAIAAVACAVLALEYWVAPLPLVPYPNQAPPLYELLARLPPGVVAEFPMPRPGAPPHYDARFAYMSTFHWKPLLNGYSGFFPQSYLLRLEQLAGFPDERSVEALRLAGARYVVVHEDGYKPGVATRIVGQLMDQGLVRLADFKNGWSVGTVLEIVPDDSRSPDGLARSR